MDEIRIAIRQCRVKNSTSWGYTLLNINKKYSESLVNIWEQEYGYKVNKHYESDILKNYRNELGTTCTKYCKAGLKYRIAYIRDTNEFGVFSANLKSWDNKDKDYNAININEVDSNGIILNEKLSINVWDLVNNKVKKNEIIDLGSIDNELSGLYLMLDKYKVIHITRYRKYLENHLVELKVKLFNVK